jgi:hypothetical protein
MKPDTGDRIPETRSRFGAVFGIRYSVSVIVLALLNGCAYYNGVYNAKHFAKQAERSERAGRTSEAADRWRIAAIHAESVVTRHPRSRWVDDAMLIRAKALVHLEQWSDAAVIALQATNLAATPNGRREAFLYLGIANQNLHRLDDAVADFDSAAASSRADVQSAALLGRGRTLLAMGRPDAALADFERSSDEEAYFERPRAALAAGNPLRAAEFADTLALRQPYHEAQWLLLLDSLATANLLTRAAGLTDVLRQRADLRAGNRARLLLADGERQLRAGNDSAAAERFRQVQVTAGDSVEARVATLRLIGISVRAARTAADLGDARHALDVLGGIPGAAGQAWTDLVRQLDQADTLLAASPTPDAFWFLRAELLRDSLRAGAAAMDAFAQMPARFPESPWTPKGILAAIALGHPDADALRALLASRYADSPYARAAAGGADAPERFAVLEDSLQSALLTAPRVGDPARAVDAPRLPGPEDTRVRPTVEQQRPPASTRPGTRPSIEP